ncbi:hypothetical protein SapgrDRAFT_0889 [Saprospira grandis DSM 2844]|uniref:Uncharacterized protein n=1 Tax=Saprospira grandis DSM 2844 TaxID=694433 RepID=J0XUL2_9BACT|nr:hypothetical protein [Saprospira grandis]EJF52621.1 hypothetical protein SapgrDRAFT_0889 [Saprospira grandis DSM 2844]
MAKLQNQLLSLKETQALIESGQILLIAGSQRLLDQLPAGQWLGGSTPYFMSREGAQKDLNRLFVSNLSDLALKAEIKSYSAQELEQLLDDRPENGFSYIALPAFSEVHKAYALDIGQYDRLYDQPILGWITGRQLEADPSHLPAAYYGPKAEKMKNRAVLMHVELPAAQYAEIEIYNPYEEGQDDDIQFLTTDFQASEALINGEKQNFAHYCKRKGIDGSLPLISNYSGALINTTIQRVEEKIVYFYAPVSTDQVYHLAKTVDYNPQAFRKEMPNSPAITACNCIVNYLNFKLDGEQLGNYEGPFTFGEVGYILLNQTLVLLHIQNY